MAVGNGGGIAPPSKDAWDGKSLNLLTIAKHFRQKGGDLVLDAFQKLKKQFPELSWHIVGGEPDFDWQSSPDIHYEGFLRPDDAEDLARFRRIMENAFLLIHPTREDTNPLVLTEAAYFGCPSLSVRDFAITELVLNGETGVLLDRPLTSAKIAESIARLIEDRRQYLKMRRSARDYSTNRFSWDSIGDVMATEIQKRIESANL